MNTEVAVSLVLEAVEIAFGLDGDIGLLQVEFKVAISIIEF